MKKKILSIIILVLACVLLSTLISCEPKLPDWDIINILYYDNIDDIRVVFGDDCIYPSRTKSSNYKVICDEPQPLDISEYVDKVEYIAILSKVCWEENFYGIPINVEIHKDNRDVSQLEYLKNYEKINIDKINVYRKYFAEFKEYVFYYNTYVYSYEFYNKVPIGVADAIIFDYVKSMK